MFTSRQTMNYEMLTPQLRQILLKHSVKFSSVMVCFPPKFVKPGVDLFYRNSPLDSSPFIQWRKDWLRLKRRYKFILICYYQCITLLSVHASDNKLCGDAVKNRICEEKMWKRKKGLRVGRTIIILIPILIRLKWWIQVDFQRISSRILKPLLVNEMNTDYTNRNSEISYRTMLSLSVGSFSSPSFDFCILLR